MAVMNGKRVFPCPVCTQMRDVRETKKRKPYVVCDPCGVQVFVRGPAGIAEFERLIGRIGDGLLTRLNRMQERYRLSCPKCGSPFWIEPELIKTSAFDGRLKGFRCPQEGCGAIVPWEQAK